MDNSITIDQLGESPIFNEIVNIGEVELTNETVNVLVGKGDNDLLRGTNAQDSLKGLRGNDTIRGFKANDTLDGGRGNDLMRGGNGDDLYYVDSQEDIPVEKLDSGTDNIISSVDLVIDKHIENLTLSGNANLRGKGNNLDNRIIGNSGRNKLLGKNGNDTLIGGRGNDLLVGGRMDDQFTFNNPDEGIDKIIDFVAGDDLIAISIDGFGSGLQPGTLLESQFALTTQGLSADTRFIYNPERGNLFFDPDGNGSSSRVRLAILNNIPELSYTDILVIE